MRTLGHYLVYVLLFTPLAGCMTGPLSVFDESSPSGARPGSPEWWSEQAMLPPGVRQTCHKGKMWPPRPRPTCDRQQFSHTYHSAHYWPLPYVCQDRGYVRDIIETQCSNGWQQETTMYDRHFELDQQLTVPGKLHLLDILEVTPLQRRTVYIQSSYNPDVDNTRLSNVQQALMEITGGACEVPVVLRAGREYSRTASEVKIINDLYNSSVPSPRLTGGTGGGISTGGAPAGP